MIRSYPHIYNLGHKAIADLFAEPVVVQEKIDGSQFSFRLEDDVLEFRSKGATISPVTSGKLFTPAVEHVKAYRDDLVDGVTYRGEVVSKPKHNTLNYARVPAGYIVLFDMDLAEEDYRHSDFVAKEAIRLGMEPVHTFFRGLIVSLTQINDLLTQESSLGGTTIEGVVIKNYFRFGRDGHALMGKYVSEKFKETNRKDWKLRNPGRAELVAALIKTYATEARWRKAVEHLRDAGLLTGAPQDIGPLMREISQDLLREETDSIKEKLFEHFWKDIVRGVTKDFPDWYKKSLVASMFGTSRHEDEQDAGSSPPPSVRN